MKPLFAFIGLALLLNISTSTAFAATIKHSSKGFAYTTGGIGDEDIAALKRNQKQFNLHLVFSIGDGEAATNVDVRIFDKNKQLIYRLLGALPRLNIRLPADRYGIVATLNGKNQSHHFTLEEEKAKRVILHWKDVDPDERPTAD